MDFKKKLKNLLQKEGIQKVQKALSPTSHNSPHGDNNSLILPSVDILPVSRSRDSEVELRCHPSDPHADDIILQTIDSLFFTSENFDPSLFELQKLPEPLEKEYIQETRQRILRELTVVSKKVFQLIQEKQSCYTGEIQRIKTIEDQLKAAIFTCKESREDLSLAKKHFTTKSLGILANYRKRQVAITLLKSLRTINTLQKTEVRLQELLSEDDYPGAIQLLLECQQAAVTYSHFHCISALSKKLQDTLENAEEQLDVALSKVCTHFDERHYAKLQRAYELLGKTHTCVDQLLMHYASAIHNTAFSVVHGFAELCRVNDEPVNLQKKQYQDLCSCLTQEIFIPCLVDLCKALWKILLSYHNLIRWHKEHHLSLENGGSSLEANGANEEEVQQQNMSQEAEYVDQKLSNGCAKIWQDIQTKIRAFLLSFDFTGFKIDEFMQILSIIHSLKTVGAEFCGSESESLQDCIQQASRRYFLRYHCSKLDELRIFLENEGWEICPVRSDFDIKKLHEFKFLQEDSESMRVDFQTTNTTTRSNESCKGGKERKLFIKYNKDFSGTPFDLQKEESDEDIYLSSSSGNVPCVNGENNNRIDTDKEDTNEVSTDSSNLSTDQEDSDDNKLFITNTTLSILRLFGRYLHLMHLLKSIAYDVAISMSQLFEYYFYAVFLFFGSENGEVTIENLSNAQLRVALSRIRDNLIKRENDTVNNWKVASPISEGIHTIKNEDTLYGLAERVVAAESTVYLALQLDKLKPFIQAHVPESNWKSIAQLFDQAFIVSSELRRPVFAGISCKAVDYGYIVSSMMEKVNWDVKELMSQHSSYVDVLLRGLQIFSMRVEKISERVPIPLAVHAVLWEQIFRFCSRMFVDGFSSGSAKKCSNSGRGLMQLDFTQFLSKLEKISPVSLKGLPEREYVDSYVKAYYLPESIMEEFLQTHSEYSAQQLKTLVNCAFQSNKRAKQKLIGIIEDIEKSKR